MNLLNRFLAVAVAAFFIAGSASAQTSGTVTNHAFAIGKGAGTTGYTSLLCGSAQLAVGQSAADPICKTITGDVTITAAGATAIGATKVTSAMLNADVFSTAHSWAGQQTFVAPILGTPASGTLTNATGLPISTGVSGLGTGVATALGVNVGTAGAVVVNGGALGTPSSGTLTSATGLPVSTGISGLGTGVATFLATPSSANLRAALTDEVGTSAAYFVGGALGTPASGTATNLTGLPLSGLTAQGAYTIVANNSGSSAVPTAVDVPTITAKASPVSADIVLIQDSAASNAFKRTTVGALSSAGSVSSVNGQTGALTLPVRPQGRLTLQTATPVMTTTQSAKTTLYYSAYQGNQIPLYDGTNMVSTAITAGEISVLTTDTAKSPAAIGASKVNDWFVWNDAGTIRLSHGPDWTSDTARSVGTALVMVNGILLNNAAITNGPAASRGTYVGTTRSNASSQLDFTFGTAASGGGAGFFGVWNMYNRRLTGADVTDSGAGYTYTTATIRQARASAGNQVTFVSGLAEDASWGSYGTRIDTVAALAAFGRFGLGFDSTTTFAGQDAFIYASTAAISRGSAFATKQFSPASGVHTISANELGDGTNANTFNTTSVANLSVTIWN